MPAPAWTECDSATGVSGGLIFGVILPYVPPLWAECSAVAAVHTECSTVAAVHTEGSVAAPTWTEGSE